MKDDIPVQLLRKEFRDGVGFGAELLLWALQKFIKEKGQCDNSPESLFFSPIFKWERSQKLISCALQLRGKLSVKCERQALAS